MMLYIAFRYTKLNHDLTLRCCYCGLKLPCTIVMAVSELPFMQAVNDLGMLVVKSLKFVLIDVVLPQPLTCSQCDEESQ